MSNAKKSKVLTAARAVFLRYGYKRVSMSDIAEAAVMSRPALYLLFKNREEIFGEVFLQWVEETIAEVAQEIAGTASAEKKLERAFEIWAVRPFEMTLASPEARELIECSFDFAQDALGQGYAAFEAAIVPVLALVAGKPPAMAEIGVERTARVLVSAVRGFKQTAATPDELRGLIQGLLQLVLDGPR